MVVQSPALFRHPFLSPVPQDPVAWSDVKTLYNTMKSIPRQQFFASLSSNLQLCMDTRNMLRSVEENV